MIGVNIILYEYINNISVGIGKKVVIIKLKKKYSHLYQDDILSVSTVNIYLNSS